MIKFSFGIVILLFQDVSSDDCELLCLWLWWLDLIAFLLSK